MGRELVHLVICEDHRPLTEILCRVVGLDARVRLIATVTAPSAVIELCARHRVDVVLMDVGLEGPVSGLEATQQIKQCFPRTEVLVMTAYDDDLVLAEAAEAGASGFLSKTEGVDALLEAISTVATGGVFIGGDKLRRLRPGHEHKAQTNVRARLSRLTARQNAILQLLLDRWPPARIGDHLGIGRGRVDGELDGIVRTLGARSRLEAAMLAARCGAATV